MSQKTTTSLRLTPFQIQALNDIAKKTGLEPSFLIRAAIDGLISHYDACGGAVLGDEAGGRTESRVKGRGSRAENGGT